MHVFRIGGLLNRIHVDCIVVFHGQCGRHSYPEVQGRWCNANIKFRNWPNFGGYFDSNHHARHHRAGGVVGVVIER